MVINEETMLPFFLDYYTNYVGVNKIIIYDGGSTDNTHNIIKEYPNVELIVNPTGNVMFTCVKFNPVRLSLSLTVKLYNRLTVSLTLNEDGISFKIVAITKHIKEINIIVLKIPTPSGVIFAFLFTIF